MIVLLALSACDFFPESTDTSGTDTGALPSDCSPEVFVPWGTLGADGAPVPASAHSETLGAEPSPYAVRLGWPSRDASRSASMLWRTDVDTLASVVELTPVDGGETVRVEGYSFLFGSGTIGEGLYRIHEVRLCGLLQPGTSYSYRVGGEGAWSDSTTFTTAPEPGSGQPLRVAIAGDSRGDYSTWATVVSSMESHSPDLYIFSGDMVELGANQAEWESWFEATGDLLARKPFLAAHGNHEFLAQHYFAQFGFPGNEEWYAVEWGDLLVLGLNDTVRSEEEIDSTQRQFIETELAATALPWRFATHHQPAWSACTAHDSNLDVREAWSPAFEAGRAQVVFAGHNHIYERSVPIRDGSEVPDGQGTVYVVSGGAGAPLYTSTEDSWWNVKANSIEHYIIGDIGADSASFVVRDLSGNIIDEFTVSR